MAKLFAISDIHGHLDEFLSALSKVDLSDKNNRLILIGDYIDNGHQSFQVISKIIELEELHPNQIITLLGNHEEWFYDWLILENPTSSSFSETIKSFFSPEELTYILKSNVNNFEAGVRNEIKNNIKFTPFNKLVKKRYRDNAIMKLLPKFLFIAGIDEEAGKLWKDLTSSEMFTNKFPITTGGFLKILFLVILLLGK